MDRVILVHHEKADCRIIDRDNYPIEPLRKLRNKIYKDGNGCSGESESIGLIMPFYVRLRNKLTAKSAATFGFNTKFM